MKRFRQKSQLEKTRREEKNMEIGSTLVLVLMNAVVTNFFYFDEGDIDDFIMF